MKKFSLRLLVLILFFGANISMGVVKAQLPVTDAASIAARALEAGQALLQAVEEYDQAQKHFQKIYGEIHLPVQMARSIYQSGFILKDITKEVSTIQRELQAAKFLSPAEKIALMRAYTNAVTQGTKMIEELQFMKLYDKAAITPLERKEALDKVRDNLVLVRDYVKTLSWRWRGINNMRISKASDDLRMELLSRPVKE